MQSWITLNAILLMLHLVLISLIPKLPLLQHYYCMVNRWLDNVKRRGDWVVDRCYLCKMEEVTVSYLFIHCDKTCILWNIMNIIFGVNRVMANSVKRMLSSWRCRAICEKKRKPWQAVPHCVICTIWRIRNKIAFKEAELDIQKLKLEALMYLWQWVKDFGGDKTNVFVNFICWPGE